MPTINNIKFINIGHKKSMFDDLVLKLRNKHHGSKYVGANTYFLAANGVGKTSLIGLIFSVIRPYSYEFPRGEGNKRRYLKDYIPKEGVSHVIIEWLHTNRNGQANFFLTGMAIDKNEKPLFYSCTYETTSDHDFMFSKFSPFDEQDNYLSLKELKTLFRDSKDIIPGLNYTEKKGEWENFLSKKFIEPELYRIQAKMNQRESNQDTMMNFGNVIEFIEKIMLLITPFKNDDEEKKNLSAVKEHFDTLKELPVLKQQVEFSENLISQLENGLVLSEAEKNLSNNHYDLCNQWNAAFNRYYEIKSYLDDCILANGIILSDDREKKEMYDNDLEKKTHEKNILETIEKKLFIKKFETSLDLKEKQKLVEEKEEYLLGEIIYFREIKDLENRIDDIASQITNTSAPLKEKFDHAERKYGLLLCHHRNRIMKIISDLESNLEENKGIKESFIKLGAKFNEKISQNKIQISNYQEEMKKIEDEKKSLEDEKIIKSNEEIKIALNNIKQNKNSKLDEITTLEIEDRNLTEKVKELISENSSISQKISNTNSNLKIIKEKIGIIEEEWNNLTNNKYFKENYDADLIGGNIPAYNIFNNEEIFRIQDEIKEKLLFISDSRKKMAQIKSLLDHYELKKKFPPKIEISEIKDFLKSKGAKVAYGWDYLLDNYSSNREFIRKWAELAPQILEGIVCLYPTADEVIKLLNLNENKSDSAIFFTDVKEIDSLPSSNTPCRTQLYHKGYLWKYDLLEVSKFIDEKKEELRKLEEIEKQYESERDKAQNFQDLLKNFIARSPEETYNDQKNKFKTLTSELISLSEKQEEIRLFLEQNQAKENSINDKINDIRNEIDLIDEIILRIEIYIPKWERCLEINSKIKLIQDEQKNHIEVIEKNTHELNSISEKITSIEIKLKDITEEHRNYDVKLKDIANSVINQFGDFDTLHDKNEILSSNIDELERIYMDAKKDFQTNPTVKKLNTELSSKKEDKKRKKDNMRKRLSRRPIEYSDVEEFAKENLNVSSEDIDRQSLDKKNSLESIRTEINELIHKINEASKALEEDFNEFQLEADLRILNNSITYLNIDEYFNQIELIKDEIDSIQEEIENTTHHIEEDMLLIDNRSENRDQLVHKKQIIDIIYNSLKTLEMEYSLEFSGEYDKEIRNIDENNFETEINSINKAFDNLKVKSEDFKQEFNNIKQEMNAFVEGVHRISNVSLDSRIKSFSIVEFARRFDASAISNLNKTIINLKALKNTTQAKIVEHSKNLENIVNVYHSIIMGIIENIKSLQRTKIPVPNIEALNHKEVFKMNLDLSLSKNKDKDYIKKQIQEYFEKLGREKEFPQKLNSYEQLIRELIKTCLKSKIKNVKFLVPRPGSLEPEYRDLDETLKASGGETTTVAILLYCLVAHYRMKHRSSDLGKKSRKIIPSSSFIMDNPFGKANRSDLVEVQLALAEALNIQIIAFSGLSEIELLDQFDTVQPLRAINDSNSDETVVVLDKEDVNYKVVGDSITRRREMKIDSFMGE